VSVVRFPTTVEQAVASPGEYRAGGTDVMDRRLQGLTEAGDLVDLTRIPALRTMGWIAPPPVDTAEGDGRAASAPDPRAAASGDPSTDPMSSGGYSLGAMVTMAQMGRSEDLRTWYPGLSAVAGSGATVQIRAVASLAGNLLQRPRCWYFRHPDFHCFKKGGHVCYSRGDDSSLHSIFDLGPSLAVHPSTLAMVLLTYDADVEIEGAPDRSIEDFLGDGTDPARENTLEEGALVSAIVLPPPIQEERWGYKRVIARRRAEWPIVEVHVRLELEGASIGRVAVAAGAVAPIPLRLRNVEAALRGKKGTQKVLEAASRLAATGASPQDRNAYKVEMLRGCVLEALERAMAGGA
jgi:xanthine dehydrogenase YagS FAD-binding subunit